MIARTRRSPGFTLLEVLVAITIGAAIITLAAAVFRTATDSRARVMEVSRTAAILRRAHEVVSRDMHCTTLPPDDSGLLFGLAATPAATSSSVLQFAAVVGEPLLVGRPSNETALIQYAVAEDPRSGRPTLWRHETPYPISSEQAASGGEEVRSLPLLPGVTGITYLFYSSQQQTWVESWEGEAGLPTALRMDLAIEGAEDSAEPRIESWIFSLPAGRFAADEAAAAASEASTE